MFNLSFVIMALLSNAAAGEDWLCTEEASQRRGNTINACGVATATTEAAARLQAFYNARAEFEAVCEGCTAAYVEPRRTQCEALDDGHRCYRLIAFEVAELKTAPVATPTLRLGISQPTLVRLVGQPYEVSPLIFGAYQLLYKGAMCSGEGVCYAVLEDGKITSYRNFRKAQ